MTAPGSSPFYNGWLMVYGGVTVHGGRRTLEAARRLKAGVEPRQILVAELMHDRPHAANSHAARPPVDSKARGAARARLWFFRELLR